MYTSDASVSNMTLSYSDHLTLFSFFQFIQSLGFYVQYIIQLGWHTDAFEQLGKSSEASYKRFVPDGFVPPDGPDDWIDGWTLFYWGWWISWSPFVGELLGQSAITR